MFTDAHWSIRMQRWPSSVSCSCTTCSFSCCSFSCCRFLTWFVNPSKIVGWVFKISVLLHSPSVRMELAHSLFLRENRPSFHACTMVLAKTNCTQSMPYFSTISDTVFCGTENPLYFSAICFSISCLHSNRIPLFSRVISASFAFFSCSFL